VTSVCFTINLIFWPEAVSGWLIARSTQANKGNALATENIMDSATIAH